MQNKLIKAVKNNRFALMKAYLKHLPSEGDLDLEMGDFESMENHILEILKAVENLAQND